VRVFPKTTHVAELLFVYLFPIFLSYTCCIGTGMRTHIILSLPCVPREALDSTLNYGAHSKFVEKWLTRLEAEGGGGADAPQTDDLAQEAQDESKAEGLVEQEN
jgi:hypothetical protein